MLKGYRCVSNLILRAPRGCVLFFFGGEVNKGGGQEKEYVEKCHRNKISNGAFPFPTLFLFLYVTTPRVTPGC